MLRSEKSQHLSDRSHMTTTTGTFHVIRNGLHGSQWYCSHLTTNCIMFLVSSNTYALGTAFAPGMEVVTISTTSAINELFASSGRRIVIESREVPFAETWLRRQVARIGCKWESNHTANSFTPCMVNHT